MDGTTCVFPTARRGCSEHRADRAGKPAERAAQGAVAGASDDGSSAAAEVVLAAADRAHDAGAEVLVAADDVAAMAGTGVVPPEFLAGSNFGVVGCAINGEFAILTARFSLKAGLMSPILMTILSQ